MKAWYHTRRGMTEVLGTLRSIAKNYDIKVQYVKSGNFGGYADPHKRIICIRTSGSVRDIISIFFHELAHFHNIETGRFPVFHNRHAWNSKNKRPVGFFQTAWRAEVYTDKVGAQLQSKFFDIPFKAGYKDTSWRREWFNNWIGR